MQTLTHAAPGHLDVDELVDTLEAAPIGIEWISPDGRILWANRAQAAIVGQHPDNYIGRAIRDVHIDGVVVRELLETARAGGSRPNRVARLRREDGSLAWVLVSAVHSPGPPERVECYVKDISQRAAAEEYMLEQLARLRLGVTQMPSVLWTTDANLRVTGVHGGGARPDLPAALASEALDLSDASAPGHREHMSALTGQDGSYELTFHGRIYDCRVHPLRSDDGGILGVVGVAIEATGRVLREREQLKRCDLLEACANERTEWLVLLQDVTRAANESASLREAFQNALRRVCEHTHWNVGHAFRVSKEGSPPEFVASWYPPASPWARLEAATAKLASKKGALPCRVIREGFAVWTKDLRRDVPQRGGLAYSLGLRQAIAFPVLTGAARVGVIEFFSTTKQPPDSHLCEVMAHVGTQLGRVIERSREGSAFSDGVLKEQQRLAQELHDSVGQELTGLGFTARSLLQRLGKREPEAVEALRGLASGIRRTLEKVRSLSRGLSPVDVDPMGFATAIKRLVADTRRLYKVRCVLEQDGRVELADHIAATNLYFIASEAVTNAMRHSGCQNLWVTLARAGDRIVLTVRDDGRGIKSAGGNGVGMKIMRRRADLMEARLDVGPAEGGGTLVTCTLQQ